MLRNRFCFCIRRWQQRAIRSVRPYFVAEFTKAMDARGKQRRGSRTSRGHGSCTARGRGRLNRAVACRFHTPRRRSRFHTCAVETRSHRVFLRTRLRVWTQTMGRSCFHAVAPCLDPRVAYFIHMSSEHAPRTAPCLPPQTLQRRQPRRKDFRSKYFRLIDFRRTDLRRKDFRHN